MPRARQLLGAILVLRPRLNWFFTTRNASIRVSESRTEAMPDPVYGLPPAEPPDDSTPVSTLLIIGGLMFAALGFVVAGLGFVVGWWGPDAQGEAVAQDEAQVVAEIAEIEPVALPGAELMPTAEARPQPRELEAVDPLAGAEPVPEIAPPSQHRNQASTTSDPTTSDPPTVTNPDGSASVATKPKPARVRVQIILGHYEHVEIKLGGKVFKLDDDRALELPPGGYRVELRKGPELPWKPAGLIDLQLGKRYRVTLFDPPLAKLEVVE